VRAAPRSIGLGSIEGETTQAGELRAIVVGALGAYARDEAVVAEALARFDAGQVSGDLANAIVAITMQQGRLGDLETCEQRRENATSPQDEQRYLFAPASSGDPAVVLDTFARAFSTVRTQDAPYLVGALIRNREAGPQVWKLMTERWDEADELFPEGSNVAMVAGVMTFGLTGNSRSKFENSRNESGESWSATGRTILGPHGPSRGASRALQSVAGYDLRGLSH